MTRQNLIWLRERKWKISRSIYHHVIVLVLLLGREPIFIGQKKDNSIDQSGG